MSQYDNFTGVPSCGTFEPPGTPEPPKPPAPCIPPVPPCITAGSCAPPPPQTGCALPPAPQPFRKHVDAPPPCVSATCDQPIAILPYCPPCELPPPPLVCGLLEQGCDWKQTCQVSVPRGVGCAPIVTGWGAYDGGVPVWAKDGFCAVDCDAQGRMSLDPTRPRYEPLDWDAFLDLNTSSSFNVRATVMRNGHPNRISVSEFTALAHKILILAKAHGLTVDKSELPVQSQFGIGMVTTGIDKDGKPTYGLSTTYAGQPIGTCMPLVAVRDATARIIGLRLPHELAQAQEE